jgi:TonB family protein
MMEREGNIIVVGGRSAAVDAGVLRSVRGSFFSKTDMRFMVIAVLCVGLHAGVLMGFRMVKLSAVRVKSIEEIPERFAKLIMEKPIPKMDKNKPKALPKTTEGRETAPTAQEVPSAEQTDAGPSAAPMTKERQVARKAVAAQVARVEQKIRTVGVLGMLTGVGTTARGPAVVDVLGAMGGRKEKFQDLDKALADVSGLQQTQNVDVLQKKLVKSKDVEVSHKENIDDLIAGIKTAKTAELAKKGDIVISRPQSIEGAASSNAKRDIAAINEIVSTHKVSIRMSYERYLKRAPDLAGKITIRFTIDAGGNVSKIDIVENTTGNKDLEDEIVRKVGMWKFESINEGDVTVTYPFIFQPAS